ncbi:MAG: GNAT family N-acetyltransferase [Oscillospiraceae bacterium]|nr:GNAT family N-acetyltransferase [Oscillospiraceae bacterium]
MKYSEWTDPGAVRLVPMTAQMYHDYFREYQNDPDLYLDPRTYTAYTYDPERVDRYIRRQIDLKRIPFAIVHGDELVGELILKNIEPGKCATMGLAMRNARYKDRGFGTRAEQLAVEYVFRELDIPVLYADALVTNTRSQHVLEKVGFRLLREEGDFKYYSIRRED